MPAGAEELSTKINCKSWFQARTAAVELEPEYAGVPLSVVRRLRQDLIDQGVKMFLGLHDFKVRYGETASSPDGTVLNYCHLFNCTGLQADEQRFAK